MNSKDKIIENIAHRIRDEFRKHESLDWALIASKKIYSSYNISLIDDADLRNKYPANVEGSNEFNLTNKIDRVSKPIKEGKMKSNTKNTDGKDRQATPPPGSPTNGKLIDGRSMLGLFNRGLKRGK